MSDFGDRLFSCGPADWEFAVRIDIRRRAPIGFVSTNWQYAARLFDGLGRPIIDPERLYCIAANQLGAEGMGS